MDRSEIIDPSGLSGAVLGAALDAAGVAVIVTSLDLEAPGPIIEYANPAMEALTGYPEDELVGGSPRMFQGPRTDREMLRELKRALVEEGRFTAEAVNYRKGGEEYVVEWTITALRDGAGVRRRWLAA